MDEDLPDGQAKPPNKKPGDLSEYNLDNYDEDEDNEAELGPFTKVKGLTYYRNNEEDPYITLKDVSSNTAPRDPNFYPLRRYSTGQRRRRRTRGTRNPTHR